MELVLLSLASCTAMDVVAILGKKKQKYTSFEIGIDSEKSQGHPKVFTKIHLNYIFTGDVGEKAVVRAIELSMEKFCSVSAMLKAGGVEVTYGHEILKD